MTLRSSFYPQPVAPVRGPSHGGASTAAPKYRLGFVLFLLVNAALFMRPTEIFPEHLYTQSYLILILACLAVSFPLVWNQLASSSLVTQPVTVETRSHRAGSSSR